MGGLDSLGALFLIWFLWVTGISEHIINILFYGKDTIETKDKHEQ